MDAAKQGIEPVVRAITEADDSTFKLALGQQPLHILNTATGNSSEF
jgi:hypothetical protein